MKLKIYKGMLSLALAGNVLLTGLNCEARQVEDHIKTSITTNNYTAVIKANSPVNIRKYPNTNSEILGVLRTNASLDKVGEYGDFYMVMFQGEIAYVSKTYTVEAKEIVPDTDIIQLAYIDEDTYLYDAPNTVKSIEQLPQYEVVEVLSEFDGWYVVRVNGEYGYVQKEYTQELSDRVVVVDISDQHLKFYKRNAVALESDVVTGKPGHETNMGYQQVKATYENAELIGPTWDVKVSVYAPFNNDGEGFHDAWWRPDTDFGGDTYMTNGSHGCVNMPLDKAKELVRQLLPGDEVIVKR